MSFSKCDCCTYEGRTYSELNLTPLPLIKSSLAQKHQGIKIGAAFGFKKAV